MRLGGPIWPGIAVLRGCRHSAILACIVDVVISSIAIFPIKSLDGITISDAKLLPSGALEHDREFALCDDDGRWVNGKRDARLHAIRSEYDLEKFTVKLNAPSQPEWQVFHLVEDQRELEKWFTDLLGIAVHLNRDQTSGFPDDSHAPGPTIISTGTIAAVSSWFSTLDQVEARRRLRANIELSADSAFWEDQLFGPPNQEVSFLLGDVKMLGVKPCKRCVVAARNPITGEETEDFQKAFSAKRLATLPSWVNRARFGPLFYRLAVNTRVPSSETGKCLSVGDRIQTSLASRATTADSVAPTNS